MEPQEKRRIFATYLRTIAIIALTANVAKEDIDRAKASGMDDYLAKPIDVAALEKTLVSSILRYRNKGGEAC